MRGEWLTVLFDVNQLGRSFKCHKDGFYPNQTGAVTIYDILRDGVDIVPNSPIWTGAQSRLDKLFMPDLCFHHLDEEAKRRNITLDHNLGDRPWLNTF